MNKQGNFRGVKPVLMVIVLEGKGVVGDPYREVKYIYDPKEENSRFGGLVGMIDPVPNELEHLKDQD